MKLAEALLLRADLLKQIAQLRERLLLNARVQEGETPAEDPQTLLDTFDAASAELERLIRLINRTNLATEVAPGVSITDALARRDVLRTQTTVYRELARTAAVSHDRYSRTEIKSVSTVDVKAVQKRVDTLAREFRELDARIQSANWQYDLME